MNKLFQIAQRSGVTVEYCHIPKNESISVEDPAGDFVLLDYGLISAGNAMAQFMCKVCSLLCPGRDKTVVKQEDRKSVV